MPFTIDGKWIPNKTTNGSKKPVKVRLVKRGNNVVTTILNLGLDVKELNELASAFKKRLGCGGAVKDEGIEIQGDKLDQVKKTLEEMGIKAT